MEEDARAGLDLMHVYHPDGLPDHLWHVEWSPQGNRLALCGSIPTIYVFQEKPGGIAAGMKVVCALEDVHTRTIRSVSWSPDSRFLAAGSFDKTVSIWRRENGNDGDEIDGEEAIEFSELTSLEGHESEVKSVAWDQVGRLLATCSRDKSVWLWEFDDSYMEFECVSVLHGHTQDVKVVKFSPDGGFLLSCSYDDTIRLWAEGEDDWSCTDTLVGHTSTVWDAAFDPAGKEMFVSCSNDMKLIIWKKDDGKKYRMHQIMEGHHSNTIFSVDWSSDGKLIASCGADNKIVIFEKIKEEGHEEFIDSEQLDDDGMHDKENKKLFRVLVEVEGAHESDVNCVRFHPTDPAILASCGDDGCLKVWKLVQ
eukprot:TRINITY_DN344_c0_g1_i1.p1 TRINITY_DN344_c0_g1~~TRINITY_DN344_c0_g1_i1.p1  ORF type:complete len:365 (-),score=92.65 TRINITY_DN344_c0_g1_i1:833-1927(-)